MKKVNRTVTKAGPFSMERLRVVFRDGVLPKSLLNMIDKKISDIDLLNLFKAEFLAQHAITIAQIQKSDSQKHR